MSYSNKKLLLFVAIILAVTRSFGQLTASFTISPSAEGCAPFIVTCTSTSTGTPDSTLWDFDNGDHSVYNPATATYDAAGTYHIKLKIKKGTATSTATATIIVHDTPTVNFNATPRTVCPNAPVSFTDASTLKSSGTGTYNWDFGDGYSSNMQNPVHSYTNSGTYSVTLVVYNSYGCRGAITKANYITVTVPPDADFDATDTHFCKAPATAQFNNHSSGTATLTYSWKFGDGGTSTSGTTPLNYTYYAAGNYTVTLVVTDGHGCKDSLVRPNYIQIHKPTANFTMPKTHACIYDTECFTNTSTGGYIFSYWTFQDTMPSTDQNPCHAFTDTGNHTIRLIVSDAYCNDTITKIFHVDSLPRARFVFTPKYPCPAPQTISFYDSTQGATTWTWDFGDGSSPSHSKNPTHVYTTNGKWPVTLTVTNANGCSSSYTDTVRIYDLFVHAIAGAFGGCASFTTLFSENVVTTSPVAGLYPFPVTYDWNWGDGSPHGTSDIISHTFYDTGIYKVVLKVTNPNGCIATDTLIIKVGRKPIAAFSAPDTTCPFTDVQFTNLSQRADSFQWDFGDGSTSPDVNPTHAYGDTGLFRVRLVALYHDCPDTVFHYIYVLPPIPIISFTAPCPPLSRYTYHFYDTSSIKMTSHLWRLGDGSTSTSDSPVHTYSTTGNYTVTLIAHNSSSGCTDSAQRVISVINPVVSIWATSDTAICRDKWASFTGQMTGGIPGITLWSDYLNGSKVNGTLPLMSAGGGSIAPWLSDTGKRLGYHTIRAVVADQNSCPDTGTRVNYMLVAKPVAGFKGTPVIGCSPLTVTFADTSWMTTGTFFAKHKWTWGSGDTAEVTTNPATYTYYNAGTYSVKLITIDNIGCRDTLEKINYITALKPHALFIPNRQYACIGDVITFDNASSIDTLHDTLSTCSWDFGDSATSTAFTGSHAYKATGTYTVRLIIQDVHGCRDTQTRTSYIRITKPHAAFTMDDSVSICPPLLVHFTNTSSGGAVAYNWDFDDVGTTATIANPVHTFNSSKYFRVSLVAMDVQGCHDTAYGHVNIYGYNGGLTYTPLLGCVPLKVDFIASITNAPTIVWDFADGVTASATGSTRTSHIYYTPGTYVPKLILGDGKGCNSASLGLDTIKVDAVIAGIWVKTPCEKDTAQFFDTSKTYFSPVVDWLWSFDGGVSFTGKSTPSKYYEKAGMYPVYLRVINGNGCRDSVSDNFMIHPPPIISAGPDTVICVHDTAILTPSGGISYFWTSAAYLSCYNCEHPKIAPTDTSYYFVKGVDIFGCKNYDTVKVGLQVKTTSFVDDPPPMCQGDTAHLHAYGAQHYSWTPADALDNSHIGSPLAFPMDTVNYVMIATEGSCIPDTQMVTLIVHPKPNVNAGPDQTLIGGTTAQLQARGVHVFTWLWAPTETLNCIDCANPVAKPYVTTDYALIGTSEYGCKDTDTVRVIVLCDKSQVFIPNAFTPNGDGENDVFYPRGVAIKAIKSFRIYNRWGEMVFEKLNININDASNAWDGSFSGVKQDPGVYMYIMDAICDTGEDIVWKGDVTIIR